MSLLCGLLSPALCSFGLAVNDLVEVRVWAELSLPYDLLGIGIGGSAVPGRAGSWGPNATTCCSPHAVSLRCMVASSMCPCQNAGVQAQASFLDLLFFELQGHPLASFARIPPMSSASLGRHSMQWVPMEPDVVMALWLCDIIPYLRRALCALPANYGHAKCVCICSCQDDV